MFTSKTLNFNYLISIAVNMSIRPYFILVNSEEEMGLTLPVCQHFLQHFAIAIK